LSLISWLSNLIFGPPLPDPYEDGGPLSQDKLDQMRKCLDCDVCINEECEDYAFIQSFINT